MNSGKESFHDHYNSQAKPAKPESDIDMEMRGRVMAADPMAAYFRDKEREKQASSKEIPTYKGHAPPNRYNIRPGYRWDGVDRSNGYEKKLMEKQAAKKANEEESYRYATRDL